MTEVKSEYRAFFYKCTGAIVLYVKERLNRLLKVQAEQLCLTYCIGVYSKRTLYSFLVRVLAPAGHASYDCLDSSDSRCNPDYARNRLLVRISTKYYCLSTLVGFLDLSDFAGYREVGNLV